MWWGSSDLVLWQWHEDGDVGDWEVTGPAADGPVIPVVVNFRSQVDDVTLFEAKLARGLGLKIVQSLASGLCCTGRCRSGRRFGGGTGTSRTAPRTSVTKRWAVTRTAT